MGNSAIMIGIWAFFGLAGLMSVITLIDSAMSFLQGYEAFLARVRAWQVDRKTLIICETDAPDGRIPLYKNYWSHQTSVAMKAQPTGPGASSARSTPRDSAADDRRKHRKAG